MQSQQIRVLSMGTIAAVLLVVVATGCQSEEQPSADAESSQALARLTPPGARDLRIDARERRTGGALSSQERKGLGSSSVSSSKAH